MHMVELAEGEKRIAKEAEDWAEKQKLLQLSEVSIILRNYDDLFSDFDPRLYDRRSLSDDFLTEIRRATKEKKGGVVEINFLIPTELRKNEKEAVIRKRVKEHFKRHHDLVQKEISMVRKQGVQLSVIGFALAIIGAVFMVPGESNPDVIAQTVQKVLLVLVEPASWFTIWTGFDKIFTTWKTLEPDLDFYKKMAHAEINFTGY